MNKKLRVILVGIFFATLLVYEGAGTYCGIKMQFNGFRHGWDLKNGNQIVIDNSRGAAPSELKDGDELLSLNGVEFNLYTEERFFYERSPGETYNIRIRRDGKVLEFKLQPPARIGFGFFGLSAIFWAFLIVGLVIFLLKPDDKQAILLSLLLAMFIGTFFVQGLMVADRPAWLTPILVTAIAASGLFPVIFFHFFLVFPKDSPLLRRFPRLEYYIYGLFLLTGYSGWLVVAYKWGYSPETFFEPPSPSLWQRILGTVGLFYIVCGLVSLIINYRYANQLSKRKLRVVIAGMIAGFLPFIVLVTVAGLLSSDWTGPNTPPIINYICFFALILVPVSFAYAIIRHQVIPVHLIIRRSLQYLFAKNALRVLIALPTLGLILSIVISRHRTIDEILLRNSFYFYLLLTAAIALGLVFRKRLTDWIDRKFFREAYNQEKILRELIDEVRATDSIPEASKLVSQKVTTALHPEKLYLFYKESKTREFSLGYSSEGPQQELNIPEEFQLLRYMELHGGAQNFPFPHKTNLPESEKEWLAGLNTQLVVPMTGTDGKLAGLFLLGPKKSEIPYTGTDRQLLETLADQIALVYENVRLKETVDHDRKIRHEVLARIEDRQINLLKECPRCGACFDSQTSLCSKDNTELTLSLPVERTVEQRYRLDQLLGKGGMGAVYEALDLRLNRRVAIKIISASMFGNSEALRRFEREAQISARLSHPNIIAIHDYGLLSTEGAYLVMDLAKGETLRSIIKRGQRITPMVAADWFDQICEGTQEAHKAGIIHRDLKPENIVISQKENGQTVVQILDFGLAKIRGPKVSDSLSPTALSTKPGVVMGTFGYMSPEQLIGTEVDERSDIFSIGVILVEALTGELPFKGSTHHGLLTKILQGSFHLAGDSSEVRALDSALQQCLAKDHALRFSSVAVAQRELIPVLRKCAGFVYAENNSLEANTVILDQE